LLLRDFIDVDQLEQVNLQYDFPRIEFEWEGLANPPRTAHVYLILQII